jgi:hypothetical protein
MVLGCGVMMNSLFFVVGQFWRIYRDDMKDKKHVKDIIKCTKWSDLERQYVIKFFFFVDVLHSCIKRSSLPLKSGILLSAHDLFLWWLAWFSVIVCYLSSYVGSFGLISRLLIRGCLRNCITCWTFHSGVMVSRNFRKW